MSVEKSSKGGKFWQGIVLLVLPMLAAFLALFLWITPTLNTLAAKHYIQGVAEQKAKVLDTEITIVSQRLEGLAKSPLLLSAIEENDQVLLDQIKNQLSVMFNGVDQLFIMPLDIVGLADVGSNKDQWRNNIEKDILMRATVDDKAKMEAYSLNQKNLLAFAQPIISGADNIGVIFLALDKSWFGYRLKGMQDSESAKTELIMQNGASDSSVAVDQPIAEVKNAVTGSASLKVIENLRLDYSYSKNNIDFSALLPLLYGLPIIVFLGGLLAMFVSRDTNNLSPESLEDDASALKVYLTGALEKDIASPQLSIDSLNNVVKGFEKALGDYKEKQDSQKKFSAQIDDVLTSTGALGEETLPQVREFDDEPEKKKISVPEHIFRAYDIRGVAEEELNDEVVDAIGKAIGSRVVKEGQSSVIVGCDGRISSGRITEALIEGIISTGCSVKNIGLVPSPLVYFACEHLEMGAGVMVTGSHNPPEFNGMKVVINNQALSEGEIKSLYKSIEEGDFVEGEGSKSYADIVDDYIDRIADDVVFASPLKVVLDCGNGAASEIAPMLYASLGCEVVPLFAEIDGTFPNHFPDPGKKENLKSLIEAVSEHKADLGLAFDGDADRLVVVTSSGQIVDADRLLMLFAKDVITRNPGADVVYDIKCTRNLSQLISNHGGRPVMWRSGHSLIKQKMRETGALLGGEFSGHFFFKERWYGFDDGLYSGARLIEMLTLDGVSLDAAIAELPASIASPEIDIDVDESSKFDVVEQLIDKSDFAEGEKTVLDGLRVDFPYGWGLIRPSNTSPKLTARFEADSEEELIKIKQTFSKALFAIDSNLVLSV